MNLEFLRPEVFDILVLVNVVVAMVFAARRFLREIRSPLPDDAPARIAEAPSHRASHRDS